MSSEEEFDFLDSSTTSDFSLDTESSNEFENDEISSLSLTELQNVLDRIVQRLADFTELTLNVCKSILVLYNWQIDSVFQDFIADSTVVTQKLGVQSVDNLNFLELKTKSKGNCPICLERKELQSLGCTHFVCTECFKQHCLLNLTNWKQFPKCPGNADCGLSITPEVLETIGLKEECSNFILNLYLSQNSSQYKWCPYTDCRLIIRNLSNTNQQQYVTCSNNHTFCFECSTLENHFTLPCDLVLEWLALVDNENQTNVWIQNNTKKCPNCKTVIQRNEGCNHIKCTNCIYEFCWICSKSWSEHSGNSYYNCFKFQESNTNSSGDKVNQSKKLRDKIWFYILRFENHIYLRGVVEDSKYARAHSVLAWSYVYMCCYLPTNPIIILNSLITELERGIELNSNNLIDRTTALMEHLNTSTFQRNKSLVLKL